MPFKKCIDHVRSGAKQLMTSNNDSVVRIIDAETFYILRSNTFPWPVNVS